jgi:hypothetical protein
MVFFQELSSSCDMWLWRRWCAVEDGGTEASKGGPLMVNLA